MFVLIIGLSEPGKHPISLGFQFISHLVRICALTLRLYLRFPCTANSDTVWSHVYHFKTLGKIPASWREHVTGKHLDHLFTILYYKHNTLVGFCFVLVLQFDSSFPLLKKNRHLCIFKNCIRPNWKNISNMNYIRNHK